MSQFRYRLQTLFDQKVRAKEVAQQVLAAAQQKLRTELDGLESCRREQECGLHRLRCARAEIVLPVAVHSSTGELMRSRRDYIHRLEEEWRVAADATAAQELTVGEAEQALGAARKALASASLEVEGLEKHRARLERGFNDEMGRKEAFDQEEMANVLFLRRRKAK